MPIILPVSGNGRNGWRTDPLYTIGESARLAQVHPVTVRRWLYGEEIPSRQIQPVLGKSLKASERPIEVSFLQLAEIVIVSRFRKKGIPLQRLRKAHKYARDTWQLEYPFARLSLETDGVRVLRRFEEAEPGASLLVLAAESGQWALPQYVTEAIETFDFLDDLASRWFPIGKSVPIVIDPRYSAGVPTIPGRRVTIQAIRKRWTAGQRIRFIAADLKVAHDLIEEALRYAERVAA
ncbi:MAG: hypothetical protein A2Y60_00320 [Chloroflexi bacterium RBG_13_54_9]|nr:MAG: hypothetical protein A2Y60_00320 [Chloroflexi bacterium RBG_13_54_9]